MPSCEQPFLSISNYTSTLRKLECLECRKHTTLTRIKPGIFVRDATKTKPNPIPSTQHYYYLELLIMHFTLRIPRSLLTNSHAHKDCTHTHIHSHTHSHFPVMGNLKRRASAHIINIYTQSLSSSGHHLKKIVRLNELQFQ
jgi:hypothetical protein